MSTPDLFGVAVGDLIDVLTVVAGVLGLSALTLFTFSTWWRTRSGRSIWVTHFVLVLLIGHFILEALNGQDEWRELGLLTLFCLALLQWVGVVVYKRWFHHPTVVFCHFCGKLDDTVPTKETSK